MRSKVVQELARSKLELVRHKLELQELVHSKELLPLPQELQQQQQELLPLLQELEQVRHKLALEHSKELVLEQEHSKELEQVHSKLALEHSKLALEHSMDLVCSTCGCEACREDASASEDDGTCGILARQQVGAGSQQTGSGAQQTGSGAQQVGSGAQQPLRWKRPASATEAQHAKTVAKTAAAKALRNIRKISKH